MCKPPILYGVLHSKLKVDGSKLICIFRAQRYVKNFIYKKRFQRINKTLTFHKNIIKAKIGK
ncbi:hypothetical protein AXF12_05100 [Capnocytophaga haemolytica]|uniref:Uncharacterized protein n=1 Tax=Capnocytophaga haemolytica TaxID=45243 RepID=A0ABM5XCT4_9FLAO|nr:hypothetical protein AXF12_05100 [Capnocytophaga haemolytica]